MLFFFVSAPGMTTPRRPILAWLPPHLIASCLRRLTGRGRAGRLRRTRMRALFLSRNALPDVTSRAGSRQVKEGACPVRRAARRCAHGSSGQQAAAAALERGSPCAPTALLQRLDAPRPRQTPPVAQRQPEASRARSPCRPLPAAAPGRDAERLAGGADSSSWRQPHRRPPPLVTAAAASLPTDLLSGSSGSWRGLY